MAGYEFTGAKWGASTLGTSGGQVTWSFAGLPGAFYSFDAPISEATYQSLVRDAFQAWETVANIDFVEVADSTSSRIRLGWDGIDGRNNTIGQAQYAYMYASDFDQLTRAEIRFDTAEVWSTAKHYVAGSVNFFAVAVHEIGHALGLAHTDQQSTIMYPTMGTLVSLSADDIAGAQALYGSRTTGSASALVTFAGTASNDVFAGTSAAETINGNGGNDRLAGGGGNDQIAGGMGVDTAVFGGIMSQFSVSPEGLNGFRVFDLRAGSPEGTDTLSGVERISFTDGTLALDLSGNAGQAYRVYQAAFDRTPDNDGLEYWINRVDGGTTLYDVARGFVASNEFRSVYGNNVSNADFIDRLYENVLGRDGEPAGVAFWANALNSGVRDKASVLAGFSESAENVALVAPVISDGIWYA